MWSAVPIVPPLDDDLPVVPNNDRPSHHLVIGGSLAALVCITAMVMRNSEWICAAVSSWRSLEEHYQDYHFLPPMAVATITATVITPAPTHTVTITQTAQIQATQSPLVADPTAGGDIPLVVLKYLAAAVGGGLISALCFVPEFLARVKRVIGWLTDASEPMLKPIYLKIVGPLFLFRRSPGVVPVGSARAPGLGVTGSGSGAGSGGGGSDGWVEAE